MTRLERKQDELNKLLAKRANYVRKGNLLGCQSLNKRIEDLEKEVEELKMYEPQRLAELLADEQECVKNEVYKNLLRISLVADAANEAAHLAQECLQQYGIEDFAFRDKVKMLCKLSQEIASIPLLAKGPVLEDFIVNNDKFVELTIRHANAYIKRKLKL